MQENRRGRLASVILQELSTVIPREIKDPRVAPVTFTRVEVASDGSFATVFITLFGESPESESYHQMMQDSLEGLASASGFLKRKLAAAVQIRHIPNIVFKEDKGLSNTLRVQELLKQIEAKKDTSE